MNFITRILGVDVPANTRLESWSPGFRGLPLVWLLDVSGRALLWILGQHGASEEKVTDEEIKMLVAEAEHHGTIESDERRMIAGVMRLGDRAVRALVTAPAVDFQQLQKWQRADHPVALQVLRQQVGGRVVLADHDEEVGFLLEVDQCFHRRLRSRGLRRDLRQ